MKSHIFMLIFFFTVGCSNSAIQEELNKSKKELDAARLTIETLKDQIEPEGKLVHTLLFKLKSNEDAVALGIQLNKLKKIVVVKDLQFGLFVDLKDEFALSEYSMMLEMSFDNKADYYTYLDHPIHIAAQKAGAQYIASPPVSFDYIKQN